jgi:peroxiredoxin
VELQGRVEQLERDGLGLVAISYDSTDVLAGFARQRGITFPLLSDAGLVEPATQLLLAVRGPSANRALVAALPGASGSAARSISTSRG